MKQGEVVKLSKLMSLALRHDPAAFNLMLDEDGWVALEDLLQAIAARSRWRWVRREHIREVIDAFRRVRRSTRCRLVLAGGDRVELALDDGPVVVTFGFHHIVVAKVGVFECDGIRMAVLRILPHHDPGHGLDAGDAALEGNGTEGTA